MEDFWLIAAFQRSEDETEIRNTETVGGEGVDRRQRMTPPQPGIGTNKLLGVRAKLSFANLSKHKN